MRVLILHADIAPGALPEDQDTLITSRAIADALAADGHQVRLAAFTPDPESLAALVKAEQPDAVFNMVETVYGRGELAPLAPAMLEKIGVPFTGTRAAPMAAAGDKPFAKGLMRAAGLPTPDWSVPPQWHGLKDCVTYVVKSAVEDASLGLDDGAVVPGADAVRARARMCEEQYGGVWFAEAYVEGREFNVSVLAQNGMPRVLPVPEMRFENWSAQRPRIVGHAAKWDVSSEESARTVRVFGLERDEPALDGALRQLSCRVWDLLGLGGFARVDFRVDARGNPFILEINPNPCLEPAAGFAAAGAAADFGYRQLIAAILRESIARYAVAN